MTNESLQSSPFEIAKQKLPIKWYELSENMYRLLGTTATIGILFSACTVTTTTPYPWYLHLVSAGLYTISEVIDTASTAIVFNAMNKAERSNVQHDYHEGSSGLAHVKNTRDLIYNPRSYITALVGITYASVIPGLGFSLVCGKTIATISNIRVAHRLNLACDIAQGETYKSDTNKTTL